MEVILTWTMEWIDHESSEHNVLDWWGWKHERYLLSLYLNFHYVFQWSNEEKYNEAIFTKG